MQASLQRFMASVFVKFAAMAALLHTQTPLKATLQGIGSTRGPAGHLQNELVVFTGALAAVRQGQHSVLVVQAFPWKYGGLGAGMQPGQVVEAHDASVVVVFLKVELVHNPVVPSGAPDHSSLQGVPSGTIPVGF